MSAEDFFQGSLSTPSANFKFVRWQPLIPGRVKLNFDGFLQNNSAAGGYIIRDWRRAVLKLGATYYGNALIIMAEGRALIDGVKEVIAAGYRKLDIEGDNLIIIKALQGTAMVPWHLRNVMLDI